MLLSSLIFASGVLLAAPAPQIPPTPCGAPWFAEGFTRAAPRGHVRGDGAPLRGRLEGATPDRDAWGLYPNHRVSEHFIAKWGNTGGVTDEEVGAFLDALERAWSVEVGDMGHPAPDGTGEWLFNVYVGDTGDGTPSALGAGGYYNRDPEGFPMIVVGRDSLRYPEYLRETAAHEFYHALQDELLSYPYTGDSAWYWEATAEWAAGEVLLDETTYAQFLFGYAFNTQLPVSFFDYPDTGTLEEYHQYGAFIFPRFLSEVVLDREAVARTWIVPAGNTPLASIRAELEARGETLEDAFGAFAARNATWAYRHGEAYARHLSELELYYDDQMHEIANVGPLGTQGPEHPGPLDLPQAYGYNVVRLGLPRYGAQVRVAMASEGSAGTVARWRVYVATAEGGATEVDVSSGVGETVLRDADEAYLVAAAVPGRFPEGETFDWSWEVTPSEAPETDSASQGPEGVADEDEASGAGGCGCGSVHAPVGGLALSAIAVGLARRRRARA
jgi:hypothetical protein